MNISSPHDTFFKNMMGRVEIAKTYIRHYIPEEITSRMDLSTLEVDTEGYVDSDLKTHFTDVVATVQLTDGQPADIYILFEHKSGLDKLARLQILKYMVHKWFQWIKNRELPDGRLPIVIPVVVYHGIRKWTYSLEFSDLFRMPSDDFRRFVPTFTHILHDISHIDENAFRVSVEIHVFLKLLKYASRPDLNHKLPGIISLLQNLKNKDRITEYLPVIIRYILNAGKMSVNEMKKAFKSLPKGEETVETTADMLIQEGREQGIVQGIEKGIVQGIEKGIEKGIQIGESRARYRSIQDMLQELLQERFDSTDPLLMEKIRSIESVETLKELFRKALRTDSLQEFSRIVDRCLQPEGCRGELKTPRKGCRRAGIED